MRIEFSKATNELLAKRAAYRCSFPECRRSTIGPGASTEDVSSSGSACHIYSAGENGPRGQGGLTPEELASSANGIWLCSVHSRLVDNNRGEKYPAGLLASYKALHEAWISRELGDHPRPFGWIQEITVGQNPVFRAGSTIRLGHVSLIYGSNGTGKSAMCEWLAATGDPARILRWTFHSGRWVPLRYRATYFADDRHEVELLVSQRGIEYILDSQPTPFNPIPFRSVLLSAPMRRKEEETDLAFLARHLQDDPLLVQNLLREVPKLGTGVFDVVEVDSDGTISATTGGKDIFEYAVVSGGYQMRLAVEMAIVKARTLSRYYPTLLILDAGMVSIDRKGWLHYMEALSRVNAFQSVLVSVMWDRELDWGGWDVARFEGRPPQVEIVQA